MSRDDVLLIHDALLATGGSMKAAYDLVESFRPKRTYINGRIAQRMEGLKGRECLGPEVDLTTLLMLFD